MCGIWFYLGDEADKTRLFRAFSMIQPRGPNTSHVVVEDDIFIGFHRLSINDLSDNGNQPMHKDNSALICNGEIYNFQKIKTRFNLQFDSRSDCESIVQLYNHLNKHREEFQLETHTHVVNAVCRELDGEFAFILYDKTLRKIIVCRDRYGVRPLFIGTNTADDHIGFSSELKGLNDLFQVVEQFEPSTFMIYDLDKKTFVKKQYNIISKQYTASKNPFLEMNEEAVVLPEIKNALINAVEKRLVSDRPVCALLSGGLDSSLVCAILSRYCEPYTLHTFSIGFKGSIDLQYARKVAEHIKSVHHEIIVTEEEMLASIPETIRIIESYDITSVRASAFNLRIAKHIHEKTNFKVVFSGEYSDEVLGGYMYFKNAPSPEAFHEECDRLISDLCFFDSLRADRCISSQGLEARVPFSDPEFVTLIQKIDPSLRMCKGDRAEKYLLRKAFDDGTTLPADVLWRTKSAFSDGVSVKEKSWHNIIKAHIDTLVKDSEFKNIKKLKKYSWNEPQTKEAYYYRKIYDEHYNHPESIPYFWLPKWCGTGFIDPSARDLADVEVD